MTTNPEAIALVLVTHEPADNVRRMTKRWQELTHPDQCLVAYGGSRQEFERIEGNKIFIDDPRLRTRDHQRELQSYSKLLAGAVESLKDSPWEWLVIAEYDLIPLSAEFFPELLAEAKREDADVLAPGACRLDNTLHTHHAAHAASPGWLKWVASLSRREEVGVVLSCLGCSQLWRRNALEAVVAVGEPFDTYLEILLPTIAHHLGFRVRPWKSHSRFVLPHQLPHSNLRTFRSAGANAVHPIKHHWK